MRLVESWEHVAAETIEVLAQDHEYLTTDDVRESLGLTVGTRPRALGTFMLSAKRRGIIANSGQLCNDRQGHANMHVLWKSLVYKEQLKESSNGSTIRTRS